jgi:hypothetical protein
MPDDLDRLLDSFDSRLNRLDAQLDELKKYYASAVATAFTEEEHTELRQVVADRVRGRNRRDRLLDRLLGLLAVSGFLWLLSRVAPELYHHLMSSRGE